METFFPNSLEEALHFSGEYRAGGTDVQARQVLGIRTAPIVDISQLGGLAGLTEQPDGGYRLGSMIRLSELAVDEMITTRYPLLATAAGVLATPQIRNRSTLGGALLQHTRCPYYRQQGFACLKKGDDTCSLRRDSAPLAVGIDLGPCAFPHPSTLGMVLLAFDGWVELHNGSSLTMSELYGDGADPARDHQLSPGDLVTAVGLPLAWENEQQAYFRLMQREASEWPIIECACRLRVEGGIVRESRIVVGGIANVPLRLSAPERMLKDSPVSLDTLQSAAAAIVESGEYPLDLNHYKTRLLPGVLLETLARACGLNII